VIAFCNWLQDTNADGRLQAVFRPRQRAQEPALDKRMLEQKCAE
jgi:hypothetical protein